MALSIYVFAGVLGLLLARLLSRKRWNMLPGPPGLPIFGNMLQLPKEFLLWKLTDWSKDYGPVFSLNVAGQPWLIVNNWKTAADILDRHCASTSDRPPSIKTQEFLSRGNAMAAEPHGPLWRLFRKGTHESLNIRACNAYFPMQQEEAANTVRGLIEHPEVPIAVHMSRTASSVVWRVLYGGNTLALNQPHDSQRIEETMEYLLKAVMPLNSVVDLLPFLAPIIRNSKWLRKSADAWYEETTGIFNRFYDAACNLKSDSYRSTCKIFQDMIEKHEITKVQSSWSAGALFMAGQDTTATTMQWFVQAMMLYPEVARKAQEELNKVIQAVGKEVLRWRPSAPVSIPHWSSEEFEYNGYVIPKDTFIIDSIWGILHDPELFPNPSTFDPSRFLDSNGQIRNPPPDTHDDLLGFGHGRRVCPGKDLAMNSLFILIATLLWALDFKLPLDETGKEIAPDPMGMIDIVIAVHPKPFKINPVPRFPDVLERLSSV
ncbi:cytochrome P450 [Dacryopinax primogenitus]|uniref:Cytochrome P450 n=1 Tax=Dacryopinax primogenitus (strain DJM 731) TaxID=1858805 RepID=M5G8D2_DACPD|nr:cytochrome P450 [Dacryopinax primogenitus]EJU00018.1 cytochrome P450 [Dacryopinax primogenitus]